MDFDRLIMGRVHIGRQPETLSWEKYASHSNQRSGSFLSEPDESPSQILISKIIINEGCNFQIRI